MEKQINPKRIIWKIKENFKDELSNTAILKLRADQLLLYLDIADARWYNFNE